MRVLVTPLMAMATSAGPTTRARALASAMASRGWKTTLCVPEGFSGAIPADVSPQPILTPRDAVVAYFGNGAVTPRRGFAVLAEALRGSGLDLYVAGLPESHAAHLHTAPRFDFSELLPRTAIFVNHGGQNSMMDGIAYGSPQLICPGKVFERRFNAKAAERCGIGLSLEQSYFDVPTVCRTLEQLLEDGAGYRASAESLRKRLTELGGTNRMIDSIAKNANAQLSSEFSR